MSPQKVVAPTSNSKREMEPNATWELISVQIYSIIIAEVWVSTWAAGVGYKFNCARGFMEVYTGWIGLRQSPLARAVFRSIPRTGTGTSSCNVFSSASSLFNRRPGIFARVSWEVVCT